MGDTASIGDLQKLTSELIKDTLRKLRSGRQHSSSDKEQHFKTAIYLLEESRAYVDGAWKMLASDRARAAFPLFRWVLEAAMDLWWAVADQNEIKQRLNDLVGEALRNEVNRRKDLAKLYPAHATALLEGAEKARKVRDELGARRLKPLSQRMEDVKPPDKPGWPDLYVLYRICCLASHPGLRVWSRFKMVGSATVSFDPVDNKIFTPEQACWMVAASTLYLALYCICLAGIRNLKALDDWWNKVEPLLAQRE